MAQTEELLHFSYQLSKIIWFNKEGNFRNIVIDSIIETLREQLH
jgi:hypothetical protein